MRAAASIGAAFALASTLLLPAAPGLVAQESRATTLGGSVLEQAYGVYAGSGGLAASDFGYGSSTTLDLNLDAKGSRARASASFEAAVMDGAAADIAWLEEAEGQLPSDELFVPTARPPKGPDLLMAARVRTLYAKLDEDWASFTAGRQVINYERGAVWSPTDIFTLLDLTGLSPERLGSDALRVTVPLGSTGGVDLAGVPATQPAQGIYSARLSGLVLGVDGALSAARDGAAGYSYLGADFKADLEAGFYGDFSYALPDSGAEGYLRAAGGADWSTGDFIFEAEYYYNGGGATADALFPGAHNVYADVIWRQSEFLNLSASVIQDLSDRYGTGTLLASYSAAQGATLALFCKTIWVEGSVPASTSGELVQGLGAGTVALQLGATLEISF